MVGAGVGVERVAKEEVGAEDAAVVNVVVVVVVAVSVWGISRGGDPSSIRTLNNSMPPPLLLLFRPEIVIIVVGRRVPGRGGSGGIINFIIPSPSVARGGTPVQLATDARTPFVPSQMGPYTRLHMHQSGSPKDFPDVRFRGVEVLNDKGIQV